MFNARITFVLVLTAALMPSAAFAEDVPAGIDALTGKDSPLKADDRIAFLGDSITQAGAGKTGYITLIEQAVTKSQGDKKVQFIKAGISGNKVPDLQRRLDKDVLSKKPTVVFIYIGINDVWHWGNGKGTKKEDYEAGLGDVIKRCQDAGALVVLATPSVIGEKTDGSNSMDKMLEEYAAISRKVAAENKLVLCDLRKAFIDYLKEHNKENKDRGILTGDKVHLNSQGNQFVANEAAAAIATALKTRK
ncbi:MAG: SGNH/GDSL hydrolase family protein [Phycisphaeraceae bacterium]